jgi:hypothetical protein
MPGEGHDAVAQRCLRRATELIASTRTPPWLLGGFAGVAWAVEHVESLLHATPGDRAAAIDGLLAAYVARSPWRADYDLVTGLAGYGVYALERLPRPVAAECATLVVARLAELAERGQDGVIWHTPPSLLPPYQLTESPDGHYDLGMAHGVPGAIAVLAALSAAGVARETAAPLLRGAVAWLLARPEARADRPGFPVWLSRRDEEEGAPPARVAWCYGDLGVAAALLAAARCAAEPEWERAALDVARRAASRPAERSGVVDAGLCHGAAGVGHVLNRLYQATDDESLGLAARGWLTRALDLRSADGGVGGYLAYTARDGADVWVDDPGLLTGAAGVALALLGAATDVEPAWDRVLLLSSRAPRRSVTQAGA